MEFLRYLSYHHLDHHESHTTSLDPSVRIYQVHSSDYRTWWTEKACPISESSVLHRVGLSESLGSGGESRLVSFRMAPLIKPS